MAREAIYQHLDDVRAIETDRLVLRRLSTDDAQALYEIASDPRVSQYLLWDRHIDLSYTKRHLKNLMYLYRHHTYYEWGVYLKEDNRLIGTCGFTAFNFLSNSAEIGYSFGVLYWGNGYATEAVAATLRYGFETLRLSSIRALYAMLNSASAAVLFKNGMRYIGEGERMIIKGVEYHIGISAISADEYAARKYKRPILQV